MSRLCGSAKQYLPGVIINLSLQVFVRSAVSYVYFVLLRVCFIKC